LYVITFYSFKGGVGRTMALVNVAAELVRRGRKVLVVDFDLEAPGLETYQHLRPPKSHPGIVEYVTEFRRSYKVPNLRDYIYETKPIGKKGGQLWVMPAGRRDPAYRNALINLDWKRLYSDQEGFLLFEDTKAGWEAELKPDYVLIDSRTGETDVMGICTRQLPDSVVLMFAPNEQNLAGLKNVCRDIRDEATEGLKKRIRLHFVAANVPDLDDEKGILRRQLAAFHAQLGIPGSPERMLQIRRYEDLTLVDQSVMVLNRPKTRLAHAYRRLTGRLLKDNPADRDGALLFLRDYAKRYAQQYTPVVAQDIRSDVERKLGIMEDEEETPSVPPKRPDELDKIVGHFLDDTDLLFRVAECRILEENFRDALVLLNEVLRLQANLSQALFDRAMVHRRLGDHTSAVADLLNYLRTALVPRWKWQGSALPALRELHAIAPDRMAEALDLPAVQAVVDEHDVLKLYYLVWDRADAFSKWIQLLRNHLDDEVSAEGGDVEELTVRDIWLPKLIDGLLEDRRWPQAISLLEALGVGDLTPQELFRLAMAYWGETGTLREDVCRLALDREREIGTIWPNSSCLLQWGIGNTSEALRLLDLAVDEVEDHRQWPAMMQEQISVWRFRDVSLDQLLDDYQQLRRMFQGEPLRPAFLGPAPESAPA
jgi:MinD-like ATPase involved in chromosome partitioning or flagellar assembly